jgi:hypothetical protein
MHHCRWIRPRVTVMSPNAMPSLPGSTATIRAVRSPQSEQIRSTSSVAVI